MNNWKSNLKRHIEKFHKGEKIVSNKHYRMAYNDEMKDEENCRNIGRIPTTDENVKVSKSKKHFFLKILRKFIAQKQTKY